MIDTTGAELFIEDLKILCKKYKVKLVFSNSTTVVIEDNIRSSGYFDPVYRVLKIGKKRDDWLQLLVHESCHLDQWIENCESWRNESKIGNDMVDRYLSGKNCDRRKLKKAFENVIKLEFDCEKRAIEKIIDYDLPINTHSYIQKANAYLLYHHTVLKTREWNPSYYWQYEIISKMPTKMMKESDYLKLPKRLEKYF